jgi:hypothetical protein
LSARCFFGGGAAKMNANKPLLLKMPHDPSRTPPHICIVQTQKLLLVTRLLDEGRRCVKKMPLFLFAFKIMVVIIYYKNRQW